jgi:hypothetical protein
LYLNGVEENFGFITAVEVVTNRLKMQKGIREKTHTNKYETSNYRCPDNKQVISKLN